MPLVHRFRVVTVFGCALALVPFSAVWVACSEPIKINRTCETTDECHTAYNNAPDTVCVNNVCVCDPTLGEELESCCPNGATSCSPNLYRCRPKVECARGGAVEGEVDASADADDGGMSCVSVADCPTAPEPRCGKAVCEEGRCGVVSAPFQKLDSQIRGDCRQVWCDGEGNLVVFDDASDVYNDGRQCTTDVCESGASLNKLLSNGLQCPETGAGVCSDGDCVECDTAMQCGNSNQCVGHVCAPMHCFNLQFDSGMGETATDCGGPCGPCLVGETCNIPSDCLDGVCIGGKCKPPTCFDGVVNDGETGIDCGGPPSCPRCGVGKGCKVGSDCLSLVCWAGVCEASKCTDGLKNGDEAGVDCGGPCPPCP